MNEKLIDRKKENRKRKKSPKSMHPPMKYWETTKKN